MFTVDNCYCENLCDDFGTILKEEGLSITKIKEILVSIVNAGVGLLLLLLFLYKAPMN